MVSTVKDSLLFIVLCGVFQGYETAKALLKQGGTVVMACRSNEKAAEARDKLLNETRASSSRVSLLWLLLLLNALLPYFFVCVHSNSDPRHSVGSVQFSHGARICRGKRVAQQTNKLMR